MEKRQRSTAVWGTILILIGAIFLIFQLFPGLKEQLDIEYSWPLLVIGGGILFLIVGILTGEPDLAVPAVVIGGIGCILYWQNATGNWASWSYVWALIPGFAGLGTILSGLLGKNTRQSVRDGLGLIFISAILFVIFGSIFGGLELLGPYWPLLVILAGLWLLARALMRARK